MATAQPMHLFPIRTGELKLKGCAHLRKELDD